MELWEILDNNRKPTGKIIARGQSMKPDEFHLVVHVWIQNRKNQFLISKRTPNKTFPNMWETTGGSAVLGDDSLSTAIKETREELGLILKKENGKLIYQFIRHNKDFNDFLDVWLFKSEANIIDLKFQADEVSDAKWATKEEIFQMIKENSFVT